MAAAELARPREQFPDRILCRAAEGRTAPAELCSWIHELVALKLPGVQWDGARVVHRARWELLWAQIDHGPANKLVQALSAGASKLSSHEDWQFEMGREESLGGNAALSIQEQRQIERVSSSLSGVRTQELEALHGDGTGALALLHQAGEGGMLRSTVLLQWARQLKKRIGSAGLQLMLGRFERYGEQLQAQPVPEGPAHTDPAEHQELLWALCSQLALPITREALSAAHGWDMYGWLEDVSANGVLNQPELHALLSHVLRVSSAEQCSAFVAHLSRNLEVEDRGWGNTRENHGGRLQSTSQASFKLFQHASQLLGDQLPSDQILWRHVLEAHGGDGTGVLAPLLKHRERSYIQEAEWRRFVDGLEWYGEAKTVFLLRHLCRNLKANMADSRLELAAPGEGWPGEVEEHEDDLEDHDWYDRVHRRGAHHPKLLDGE